METQVQNYTELPIDYYAKYDAKQVKKVLYELCGDNLKLKRFIGKTNNK